MSGGCQLGLGPFFSILYDSTYDRKSKQCVTYAAGHKITKLRASLNFANVADLIFIHDSWPIVVVYNAEKNKKRKGLFSYDKFNY